MDYVQDKLTEQITFAGESQPFLLIRSGTASKPSYTISALRTPSVPLMLRADVIFVVVVGRWNLR